MNVRAEDGGRNVVTTTVNWADCGATDIAHRDSGFAMQNLSIWISRHDGMVKLMASNWCLVEFFLIKLALKCDIVTS